MSTELESFYDHVDDIEIAMMVTRRSDDHLDARPMATQKRASGADLWFVTIEGSSKARDLEEDPHVNLSYYKDRTREWISVSGLATLSRDKAKIAELYAPDWRIWLTGEDDPRYGTAEDPRLVLIGVSIHTAAFLEVGKPQPIVLYELVKSLITHETPELGETRRIGV